MFVNYNLIVTTVLTVYGIETLQLGNCIIIFCVTTVLTVYGIETFEGATGVLSMVKDVTTVLTVYGIETISNELPIKKPIPVTTVLTVYGIETCSCPTIPITTCYNSTYRLRY